jgi:hypothetical protein
MTSLSTPSRPNASIEASSDAIGSAKPMYDYTTREYFTISWLATRVAKYLSYVDSTKIANEKREIYHFCHTLVSTKLMKMGKT